VSHHTPFPPDSIIIFPPLWTFHHYFITILSPQCSRPNIQDNNTKTCNDPLMMSTTLTPDSRTFPQSIIIIPSFLTLLASFHMIMDRHVTSPYPLALPNFHVFKSCPPLSQLSVLSDIFSKTIFACLMSIPTATTGCFNLKIFHSVSYFPTAQDAQCSYWSLTSVRRGRAAPMGSCRCSM